MFSRSSSRTGQPVVADPAHRWATCDKNGDDPAGGRPSARRPITGTLRAPWSGELHHHGQLCGPVEYPERPLPIDPCVLGIWLGDGTTTTAEITCADHPIRDEIARAGAPVAPTSARYRYLR